MKVSVVTILSNNDGNTELTKKVFSTFESASKYLQKEYNEIKNDLENDEYTTITDEYVERDGEYIKEFFLEDDPIYWISGEIEVMEVEQ